LKLQGIYIGSFVILFDFILSTKIMKELAHRIFSFLSIYLHFNLFYKGSHNIIVSKEGGRDIGKLGSCPLDISHLKMSKVG
jgi:hypothetical protein